MSKQVGLTEFATRHFKSDFAGTKVRMSPEELVELANTAMEQGAVLVDGYAPFCKHLFIKNTSVTTAGIAKITPENEHLLKSGYEARRPGELPVLTRWFEGLEAPTAVYLDLILYSREQLEKEGDCPDAAWGIVSINGELQEAETPMPPVTMMRNALGKEEGGSGVPLDREAYARSVDHWSNHAAIK